jgi:hypothetical protein
MQLRRIVAEFPRNEPQSYAFELADTASFEEEIDEWFGYNEGETMRLSRARVAFGTRWKTTSTKKWNETDWEVRKQWLKNECITVGAEESGMTAKRRKAVARIMHVMLGVWDESAGPGLPNSHVLAHQEKLAQAGEGEDSAASAAQVRSLASRPQVDAMRSGVKLLTECGGLSHLWTGMRRIVDGVRDDDWVEQKEQQSSQGVQHLADEVENAMTVLYVIIEVTRNYPEDFKNTKRELLSAKPNILHWLMANVAMLRWDDHPALSQVKLFNLFWKALLLSFGGSKEYDELKYEVAEELQREGNKKDLITASPLDYHVFRQEITSKYPAYIPPAELIPLEPDHNSILPPLPNQPPKNLAQSGIIPAATATSGASIIHQPVHIATPAPSPPPSPPVGGKGGKKQNYQTNQNFPFMYPPLDHTSNSAGGKGFAGAVTRKWEGSEIPISILEAGELFSKRIKMTRVMRQLWDEREAYLRYERGLDGDDREDLNLDVDDDFELDEALTKRLEKLGREDEEETKLKEIDTGPREVSEEVRKKLEMVDEFFAEALPGLQSIVIVLLKAVLAHVTAILTQPAQNGLANGYQGEVNLRANGLGRGQKPMHPGVQQQDPNQPASQPPNVKDLSTDDCDALRSREIMLKSVSGILFSMLKWFKVSRKSIHFFLATHGANTFPDVLKFEYLTQLLLDSNYIPLVLKLFAHQEVEHLVSTDCNRPNLSFFAYCNRAAARKNTNSSPSTTSPVAPVQPPAAGSESSDDAAPPPIRRNRNSPPAPPTDPQRPVQTFQRTASAVHSPAPTLDESGRPIPQPALPPSTDYSWRNFYSCITFLRVLQKLCRGKPHRNLLLVQYKSSQILKKALKVPDEHLRLYTLKLFKGQVPYCGRKWRQGNMRVITQVYLYVPPELRDEWLSGGDVDGEVEGAVSTEAAGRAITRWGLVRRYREKMVVVDEDEDESGRQDWFRRELDKMEAAGWGEEEGEEGWAAGFAL